MLCQFSFSNFRSYRDETVFDMQATIATEHQESLITSYPGIRALPTSVIYGPNGGGKSNLLAAFGALIDLVVRPIKELKKNRVPIIVQESIPILAFAFDDKSKNLPTSFEVFFTANSHEYRYYISILHGEVIEESLYRRLPNAKKPAKVFVRTNDIIEVGTVLKAGTINKSVNAKMPFLSFLGINYESQLIRDVITWFESCIVKNYASALSEFEMLYASNDDAKKVFIGVLNSLGIDIRDFHMDDEKKALVTERLIEDQRFELNLLDESDGTQKLFNILPLIVIALTEGRTIVIDELDAKLHPNLLRNIVKLFTSPEINRLGAQLVFTSHDMTIMKNSIFRRDEIWFACLGESHASRIYSLFDIQDERNEKVSTRENYNKQYLEGRYGADPYFRKMMLWGDET